MTHRYPGIRSDSDLYTYGYRFKPWTSAPIASAAEILEYMGEVIDENDLAPAHPLPPPDRLRPLVQRENRWTIEATRTDTGEAVRFTANFLWMCQGYYRHSQGYTPQWDGMERFKGTIVHPQTWPDDLDYKGKKVIVIGSGATAATLHPGHRRRLRPRHHAAALADLFPDGPQCRSSWPRSCAMLDMQEEWIHEIVRRKILYDQDVFTRRVVRGARDGEAGTAGRRPSGNSAPDDDIAAHFTPNYRPWRQRIAFVPDGGSVQGHVVRKGLGGHRRDRAVHRDGHPVEVGQGAGGRHHHHRDRVPSQRPGRHRLRH